MTIALIVLIVAILLDQLNEKRKSARTIAHAERAMEQG